MKKALYLCLPIVFILTSCGIKTVPIKGAYQDKPYEITTSKTKDQVWESVIDLFAQKGLSIKVVDRSSGLIVSEKTNLNNLFTTETSSGQLNDPTAYVVVERKEGSGMPIKPTMVTGDWNVRIKESDGKTLVNVNLVNIEAYITSTGNMYSGPMRLDFQAKSTGVFEKFVSEIITK